MTYNLDVDDLDVEYLDSDGSVRRMPVGMLSDGYRSTLGMVANIAYRMALLNLALGGRVVNETPGVVLIDEVDLHLHPLWQARVLGDLRDIFPRVQFIVTTHAPAGTTLTRSTTTTCSPSATGSAGARQGRPCAPSSLRPLGATSGWCIRFVHIKSGCADMALSGL